MKIRIALYLLLFFAFFRCAPLLSEEQPQKPIDIITVVAIEGSLPFSFKLPDGTLSGLYVEFWELWSKTNNIPIRFKMVPFKESLQLIKQKNTLHAGLFRNEQREQWADFSLPIHNVQTGIIYNNALHNKSKLKDLNELVISTQSESFQEFYLKEHFPDFELSTYNSLE